MFEELAKKNWLNKKKITDEIKHDDLTYCFTRNNVRKRFDDFNDGIEIFRKIQSCEMKLEEAKKLKNIFKSDLTKISRGRFKSKYLKSALENIKLLTNQEKLLLN